MLRAVWFGEIIWDGGEGARGGERASEREEAVNRTKRKQWVTHVCMVMPIFVEKGITQCVNDCGSAKTSAVGSGIFTPGNIACSFRLTAARTAGRPPDLKIAFHILTQSGSSQSEWGRGRESVCVCGWV
jgi:hypothetical protein